MRFTLILHITSRNRILPINYQYPLHSWIYRVIQTVDAEFSRFLHDEGYGVGNKMNGLLCKIRRQEYFRICE